VAARRVLHSSTGASFAFPEDAMPEFARKGWASRYSDYLYLAFTNSTAFSPTDTLPIRTWAMMVQAIVSLVIAVMVIARAINVLPA